MQALNASFINHAAVLWGLLGLFCLVLLLLLLQTRSRLARLQQKYDFFTRGKRTNIDGLLTTVLQELRTEEAARAELEKQYQALAQQTEGCLQVVKMKRYDAFDAMGGELSFSLLLADKHQDGVILTNICGREEQRSYIKGLQAGRPSHPLTQEEQELLSAEGVQLGRRAQE